VSRTQKRTKLIEAAARTSLTRSGFFHANFRGNAMLHLLGRDMISQASTFDLDPQLRELLIARIAALVTADYDLRDHTEYLIVDDPDDSEVDIVRHIGLSPMVEPFDGIRFGSPGFHPFWDYLQKHDGWFEMIITFGSAYACVLLIRDADCMLPDLISLCRQYV
jgi:hypothetical protein